MKKKHNNDNKGTKNCTHPIRGPDCFNKRAHIMIIFSNHQNYCLVIMLAQIFFIHGMLVSSIAYVFVQFAKRLVGLVCLPITISYKQESEQILGYNVY